MEINLETEEAFERYYSQSFTPRDPYWLGLGICSLVVIGVLAGMIVDWHLGGDMSRALPGNYVPNQTQYVFLGGTDVEVKVIEYVLMFGAGVTLLVSLMMTGK